MVGEGMQGLITERHFVLMERVFPGIREFYLEIRPRPITFLELLWRFEASRTRDIQTPLGGQSTRRRRQP